ncbi:MAG: hypothetical protein B7Y80_13375 [Hyphomicrobium sp. 32-62-53]|nr:MAG: hypothetical protein B7Z29_12845 [Hyphomicrobium sp. 12-62-95]OYX99021.1 MAG: hypothetical protein B7Y80_13375 [Hyphomicrobium sp. 32-62-53]
MTANFTKLTAAALATLSLAACADGSTGLLSTASLGTTAPVAASPQSDQACVALTARIDALRRDGVVERVEKASTGKSKTVNVKRESLAKVTELDKANAEFQAKCALPLTTASVRPAASATQAALATAAQPSAAQQAKASATTAATNAAQKVAKP